MIPDVRASVSEVRMKICEGGPLACDDVTRRTNAEATRVDATGGTRTPTGCPTGS